MVPDMIAPDQEMHRLSERIFRDLGEVREFLMREEKKGF